MEEQIRFDGRIAIVTGGGSGLGRAYSNLLGSRGATVIVNDLPDDRSSATGKSTAAAAVAAEVVAAGGKAVAIGGDVTSEEAMNALVQQTIEDFDKIDILISNAGDATYVPFNEMSLGQFDRMIRVHIYGTFLPIRAAWPHMLGRGYGRIVTTCSAGMFGLDKQAHYGAAKGGVSGFTKSISLEGHAHGVLVNGILPIADTPLGRRVSAEANIGEDSAKVTAASAQFGSGPELVAPTTVWLAHENCQVTGELFQSGFGVAQKVLWGCGQGYVNPAMTLESVRDHWAELAQSDPTSEYTNLNSALEFLMNARMTRAK